MPLTPRFLRALPLMAVALVFSCSQNPRMDQSSETEYIRMLREEFFKTHPNGVHNEYISRGEVVRGMDFLEGLASWGNPIKREKPTPNVEYWLYLEEDEDSKDWTQYKFIFRQSVLDDWEMVRHRSEGGLEQRQSQPTDVLTKGSGASGTGSKPKK
jgi:hypothetical protein